MRREIAQADRAREVRLAARSWYAARRIGEEPMHAIEALFPDDRVRVGPVFRVLLFLASFLAAGAGTGVLFVLLDSSVRGYEGSLPALAGMVCIFLTEWQTAGLRRSGGGTEEGTAWSGILLLLLGIGVQSDSLTLVLFVAALLFGAAAHRWGFPCLGLASAAALFLFLARFPLGRASWVLAALVLSPILLAGSESARVAPSHRRALKEALVVGLVALYAALNPYLVDIELVEGIQSPPRSFWIRESTLAGSVAWVATILIPMVLVLLGIRTRRPRPLLLRTGAVMTAASLATLRHYLAIAPIWATTAAGGVLLIGTAITLRRWLDGGANRARGAFTAQPLLARARGHELAEMAIATVIGPRGRSERVADPGYRGEGGRSGGAGASGEF